MKISIQFWPVSQLVEKWTHNPLVTGSSPVRPTNFRGCTGFDFTSAPTVACRGCLVCRVTNRGKNRLPLIAVTADSMRSALDSLPTTVRASVPVNRSVRSLPNAEQAAGGWRRKPPLIKHVDTVGVPVEDGGSTPPTSTFSSAWRNPAALTGSRSHSVVAPNYRYVTGRAVRVSPHRSAVRRRTDTANSPTTQRRICRGARKRDQSKFRWDPRTGVWWVYFQGGASRPGLFMNWQPIGLVMLAPVFAHYPQRMGDALENHSQRSLPVF